MHSLARNLHNSSLPYKSDLSFSIHIKEVRNLSIKGAPFMVKCTKSISGQLVPTFYRSLPANQSCLLLEGWVLKLRMSIGTFTKGFMIFTILLGWV